MKSKREVEKAKLFSRITGLEQVNAALQIESKKQDDANANGKGKGKGKGKAEGVADANANGAKFEAEFFDKLASAS